MKKYGIAALLAVFVLVASQSVSGSSMLKSAKFATDTRLQVFGQTVDTDIVAAEKVGVKGTTNYVSARDLALYLGYQVEWDNKNKIISVGLYPQYGKTISAEQLAEAKPQIDETVDALLGKLSTRQLASLNKELAYYQQIFDGDPVVLTLAIVDDYKGYKSGSESQFDYIWKTLDTE